jgi:hypothetical protein
MTMASTISEFVWPGPALANSVTAMGHSGHTGCALGRSQRFNFLGGVAIPAVILTFAGDWHLIDQSVLGRELGCLSFPSGGNRAEHRLEPRRVLLELHFVLPGRAFCDGRARAHSQDGGKDPARSRC